MQNPRDNRFLNFHLHARMKGHNDAGFGLSIKMRDYKIQFIVNYKVYAIIIGMNHVHRRIDGNS